MVAFHRTAFERLINTLVLAAVFSFGAQLYGQEPDSLEGSNWQLVRMVVLGGFEFTPEDPGKFVINFRTDNRLTGESDCNSFVGNWFQEGSSLRFEPFAPTRKLCEPGSLHNNFALIMRGINASQIVDGHLLLTTDTDGVLLEFEAR